MADARPATTLLYGDTGSTKTTQIGMIARWEYERTGRITRLISADAGWEPLEPLIAEGIIEPWGIQYVTDPFGVLTKLADGYWPQIQPGGKLKMFPPTEETWKRVGMYAVEGLSTIGNICLMNHVHTARKVGEGTVGQFSQQVETDKGTEVMQFGKAAMSHFGHVQDFVLLELVPRFAYLPVAHIIWTAHETRGDDKEMGDMGKGKALGPATVGKATAKKTGMKFGDTFHLVKVVTAQREKGRLVMGPDGRSLQEVSYRAFYEDHPDEDLVNMNWPAKVSTPVDQIRALHSRFPGGYVPLEIETGITTYLDFKYGGKK